MNQTNHLDGADMTGADPHGFSIEATNGYRHHFDSDRLDARYAAQRHEDGSIEVTIRVSDPSGVLKEFVVRRFAHNEAHDIIEA